MNELNLNRKLVKLHIIIILRIELGIYRVTVINYLSNEF